MIRQLIKLLFLLNAAIYSYLLYAVLQTSDLMKIKSLLANRFFLSPKTKYIYYIIHILQYYTIIYIYYFVMCRELN